jgi:DNA polymerase III delta subunit
VYLLLPMIARQVRLVWQAKAQMEGIPDAELKEPSAARLGDWQKQKLQRQARAFTWAALEDAMVVLFETDLAIKGIEERGEDPRALLETLILRLCGLGGGRLI